MTPDSHDGFFVEVCKVAGSIIWEEVFHPLQGMSFQVGLLFKQVCLRQRFSRRLVTDVVQEGGPFLEGPSVDLFHATACSL